MRVITKRIFIAFLGITLSLAAVSCGGSTDTTAATTATTTTEDVGAIPELSNPDKVFYSTDDYQVTYNDLYDNIKVNRGLQLLLDMVDKDLLSTYISQVTAADIAEKTKYLIYNTTDDDEIAKLSDDEKAADLKSYNDTVFMNGYENNSDDYVKMIIAKENYAIEMMSSADNANTSWYVGPDAIATNYDDNYFPDTTAIKVRFSSLSEATNVLRNFNLVSLNGALKLYTGTTPLNQLPSSELNNDNTRALTNAELMQKFIQIYNYQYQGTNDPISESATVTDLINNQDLKVNYDTVKDTNEALATYMFKTLGNYVDYVSGDNTALYYTYQPVKYLAGADYAYFLIFNVSNTGRANVTDFDGTEAELISLIGQAKYDEIKQELVQKNLDTQSFVANRIAELRDQHGFKIFDYYLAFDYQNIYPTFDIDPDGNASVLFSYDGKDFTADQFLTYALNQNARLYLVYASQDKALMAAHFEDVYCPDTEEACEYTLVNNTSDAMLANISNYDTLEGQFNQSGYGQFYTFNQYLYLAYGAKNEEEMLAKYFVKSSLQPLFLYDHLSDNDYAILKDLQQYIDIYYNNYFNLDVKNLLIYFDQDEDGNPDNYSDFYSGLQDQSAYDTLLASFKADIQAYLADNDNDLKDFVDTYNTVTVDDETWGSYKQYGFNVQYKNLSSSSSLDYKTALAGDYEDSYIDALKALYNDYVLPENNTKDFMYSDGFVENSKGLNLIYATKGDEFEKPTFKFEMTYDDNSDPEYTVGLANDNDTYTLDQLKIFAEYYFNQVTDGITDINTIYGVENPVLPATLIDAYEAYFSTVYQTLYNVGYLNTLVLDQLLDGTLVNEESSYFTKTSADLTAGLNSMYQYYSDGLFSDFDNLK